MGCKQSTVKQRGEQCNNVTGNNSNNSNNNELEREDGTRAGGGGRGLSPKTRPTVNRTAATGDTPTPPPFEPPSLIIAVQPTPNDSSSASSPTAVPLGLKFESTDVVLGRGTTAVVYQAYGRVPAGPGARPKRFPLAVKEVEYPSTAPIVAPPTAEDTTEDEEAHQQAPSSNSNANPNIRETIREELQKEFDLLNRLCDSPQVVRVLHLECLPSSTANVPSRVRMYMELAKHGTLKDEQTRKMQMYSTSRMHELTVRAYLREVLVGLAYLHENGVLHRDLKPQNVLVNATVEEMFGTAFPVCVEDNVLLYSMERPTVVEPRRSSRSHLSHSGSSQEDEQPPVSPSASRNAVQLQLSSTGNELHNNNNNNTTSPVVATPVTKQRRNSRAAAQQLATTSSSSSPKSTPVPTFVRRHLVPSARWKPKTVPSTSTSDEVYLRGGNGIRSMAKLTDFGTARWMGSSTVASTTAVILSSKGNVKLPAANPTTLHVVGTAPYMAPEAVRGKYSEASDVWSVAMLWFELCTDGGMTTWLRHLQARDAFSLVLKLGSLTAGKHFPPIPVHLSPRCQLLLLRCFAFEPADRPSVVELLQDPYFAHSDWVRQELQSGRMEPIFKRE